MKVRTSFDQDNQEYYTGKGLDDKELLLQNIEKAKEALHVAYSNFDFVTEPELIDSCIYELNSIQMKYKYLIQQAKELGIIAKGI